jgi:hypothetical protein
MAPRCRAPTARKAREQVSDRREGHKPAPPSPRTSRSGPHLQHREVPVARRRVAHALRPGGAVLTGPLRRGGSGRGVVWRKKSSAPAPCTCLLRPPLPRRPQSPAPAPAPRQCLTLSTSRWPPAAASRQHEESHGSPLARAHCSTFRCPPPASAAVTHSLNSQRAAANLRAARSPCRAARSAAASRCAGARLGHASLSSHRGGWNAASGRGHAPAAAARSSAARGAAHARQAWR